MEDLWQSHKFLFRLSSFHILLANFCLQSPLILSLFTYISIIVYLRGDSHIYNENLNRSYKIEVNKFTKQLRCYLCVICQCRANMHGCFQKLYFNVKNMGIILVNKICKNFTFKCISFVRGKEIKNIKNLSSLEEDRKLCQDTSLDDPYRVF